MKSTNSNAEGVLRRLRFEAGGATVCCYVSVPIAAMTSTDSESPIIDTHVHVYTLDMPRKSESWYRPSADASIDDYIAALDENTFGILAAASLCGDYNDYQLEAVRRHKRLRTTVIVDPRIDPDQLRRMNDAGVVGIRLQLPKTKSGSERK
jgi:predicted TIM-barrel fold metal-dependent hydrolase